MSEAAQQLLEQIRALPDADREWLTAELTGEPVADEDSDDPMDDPEWRAEFERRLEQVQKHPDQLIDHADAMRMIREHLAAQRGEQPA